MNAAQKKAAQARLANQAEHYNAAQARAAERGPMHLLTFWTNVCRKLAKDALENGDPTVANNLASHLNDFYRANAG
ncbi:hypothetical protein ACFQ0G_53100 [Streptomyces chiangmaiensis]|uniref:hypothetical protein n=1 Tax=Streptomyces chiangmaiensis TaxID=766497 RepID=UPI0031EC40D8